MEGGFARVAESELLFLISPLNSVLMILFSPVKSMVKSRPGVVIVKMGMFPRIPAPEFETFALHRHEWQGKHDDVVQYKIRPWEETL